MIHEICVRWKIVNNKFLVRTKNKRVFIIYINPIIKLLLNREKIGMYLTDPNNWEIPVADVDE